MRYPLKRIGLNQPGMVKTGQPVGASWLNQIATGFIRKIIPGPGIEVKVSGQDVIISSNVKSYPASGNRESSIITYLDKTIADADAPNQARPKICWVESLDRYYYLVDASIDEYVWAPGSFVD